MEEWREKPLEDRIVHALVKGIDVHITDDVETARLLTGVYPRALNVIEGPLMEGNRTVLSLDIDKIPVYVCY